MIRRRTFHHSVDYLRKMKMEVGGTTLVSALSVGFRPCTDAAAPPHSRISALLRCISVTSSRDKTQLIVPLSLSLHKFLSAYLPAFHPTAPSICEMHLVLTGATGLVGSAVLHQMLVSPTVSKISILSRRPVAQAEGQPKAHVIIHKNYAEYPPQLLEQLKDVDGVVWAQGISSTQVSKT
jgi:hypothetical protein